MKVLLIEDEYEIREYLRTNLVRECFAVDVCEDGKSGYYSAKVGNYDMLILDNMLPQQSGREICQKLRAEGKDVPILMLSVRSEIATKVELLNLGADDYLIKPFSFEELLARIHALLRRPQKLNGNILEVEDLQLDCLNHLAIRDGKNIYLSRKEFMLLEYLVLNRGNVVSRAMIMEHVWDMNADPFSNTIESHILSLRKKIDSCGKKKLIETVSGRGYKIV